MREFRTTLVTFKEKESPYFESEPTKVIEIAALEQANEKIKLLEEKLEVAVEALKFYADKNNWICSEYLDYSEIVKSDIESLPINEDEHDYFGGKQSRQALEKIRGKNETT